MGNEVKYGEIKIYGTVIDLDNISNDDLLKVKNILENRLENLSEKYTEIDKI